MSFPPRPGHGRFTTRFTAVAAGDVQVPGTAPGSAGSSRLGKTWLSSLAAVFTVSPETLRALPPAPVSIGLAAVRRYVPARPGSAFQRDLETIAD